ncbi:hypothetical protein [Anabaena sp. UHCC 0451]|uniref:hypothetical protein n=1 Tax=Anabaena sp. UHCC 0451 TaxID=2055235 RepID=UPI002B1F5434|nr:hypothetical protein [Anabaena sp. UHCC 0451]MEA5579540.1 hypothetical protein [Anabaena sp. UHCC 0451]
MTTLFDLNQFTNKPQIKAVSDSYWDEIVLDSEGTIDQSGQTSLFYDDSQEPPDPDDYPDQENYDRAWSDWEKLHSDFKPEMTFPEQEEEEFIDDVVLEELPMKLEFIEDGIYWHEGRQLKAKIIKIYKSVQKADVYYAGDIFKERIYLSELSSLPEQDKQDHPERPRTLPEKSLINQWVERYYVTRSGNKYWYNRYCYYQKRIKHIHIPNKPDLKERVERAIALGKLPHEIEKLIKST